MVHDLVKLQNIKAIHKILNHGYWSSGVHFSYVDSAGKNKPKISQMYFSKLRTTRKTMIFIRIQTEMQSTSPDNLKIIKNHTIITYKQQVIRYHEIIEWDLCHRLQSSSHCFPLEDYPIVTTERCHTPFCSANELQLNIQNNKCEISNFQ